MFGGVSGLRSTPGSWLTVVRLCLPDSERMESRVGSLIELLLDIKLDRARFASLITTSMFNYEIRSFESLP